MNLKIREIQKINLVGSELGMIPKKWEVVSFSEIATPIEEKLQPYEFQNELFDHYSIPAYDESELPNLEYGKDILSTKYLLSEPCVLLSKLNPRFSRVWLFYPHSIRKSISSTEFIPLKPKSNINLEFLYGLCSSKPFLDYFSSLVTGTSGSHQRVKPKDLFQMRIILPEEKILKKFDKIISPYSNFIKILLEDIENLTRIRQHTIPWLISGRINIKNIKTDNVNNIL